MATLNFKVLKARRTAKKTYPIYLAVTHKRDVRYISTDYEVDDLFQFDNGKVVCRKDAKIMNQRLAYVLSEYQEKLNAITNQPIYTCAQLKDLLEGKQKAEEPVFIKEYMTMRIEDFRKAGQESYADMNTYTLEKILSILGDISLQSFTPGTIDKFIKGMSNLSNATIQMRLAHLKARLTEAVREGLVNYDISPFAYVKLPKTAPKQLDITIEEFVKIKNFETVHKRLGLAKDIFLLSFYLGGMNLADIVNMNFKEDTISYIRQKTANKKQGEKRITFTIPEEAKPIIKKYMSRNGKLDFGYNYTYKNFLRYVNYCLKLLKEKLQIQSNLSCYSARKTFSQFAFDLGIKTEIIEYCIGQSMKENRPIYNYVRVMQKQADKAIRRVIDYSNMPENFELDVFVH